ncbi:hypothetical protein CSB45_04495 [candidate division KSB3 bacterium]|uniref:Alginate export domain-containing protein n=1 Tax=candidate division KSB3 bacterium TaxID=2044937 RepID=A0A2G6E988_9BACT|nr:MAG: hypothetical protein CSB45_04495 [candidate division KSB3 bacterium]PIE30636.1 MAG: hypothetical protein CSA57_03080 [candidate division KSB3 bacterium]
MKRFTIAVVSVLAVLMALPVMAQDEDEMSPLSGGLTFARYRFDYDVRDLAAGSTSEFFEDDFDTTFTFKKGEIELWFEIEFADNVMGDDNATQNSYSDAFKGYGAKWTPESLSDSEFFLQVGDLGTGFGKNVNNDDSPRGSIEVGFTSGTASFVLGYGRTYEGNTDDDAEGDGNLIRGQVSMPLGESGFTVGTYLAGYFASDIIIQEAEEGDSTAVPPVAAVPEIKGDSTVFLGSLNLSGTAGSFDVFAETGFASGTDDTVSGEIDLSGFYLLGGFSMPVGTMTLGVETGFGTGNDPDTSDNEGFLGVNNDFGIDMIIEDALTDDGLSNKMYAKLSLSASPTEKMGLDTNFVYVAPVEDVDGVNGTTVDSYGFEVNGSMNYKLADNLKYILEVAFASLEEDWLGESSAYKTMNRLEFKF